MASAASDEAERRLLATAAGNLVRSSAQSAGNIVYAQFGGLRATQASVMVILRRRTRSPRGTATITRTIDVRLRLKSGRWKLEKIASLGGSPVRRPDRPSTTARRVLDNPRIELMDSARWDIYRRDVDIGLSRALNRAARAIASQWRVLRSGHPINVFATRRPSAHTGGYAADMRTICTFNRAVFRVAQEGARPTRHADLAARLTYTP